MRVTFAAMWVVVALVVAAATGCSREQEPAPPGTQSQAAPPGTSPTSSADEAPIPDTASPLDALPEGVRRKIGAPFTGDFDAMVERHAIRVGVTFNRTHYFIDRGQERGLTYESLKAFENDLNADLKTGNLKVHVVIVPMSRDQLYLALTSGQVDMVAAMVTVTPEREKLVAFSEPTRINESEVVVTGPGAPPIVTVDDLAGQEVFVRKGSIYDESLMALNGQLKARGKPPVVITAAPNVLEDDDVLEMVNAGLAPITVVDDYLAEFWSTVFTNLTVHRDFTVRSGGSLAVAFRKENPKLREVVNTWLRKHGKGDAFRNVIERRYLQNASYAKNAAADAERQKLRAVVELFKKYSAQYNMRFMIDRYYANEPMDDLNKGLMAFASYNAGPGRIRQLRRETQQRGLDPNVWFGNVERIASERIGRETVTYVSNIFKYYTAYRLITEQQERRAAAKAQVGK